MMLLSAHTHCSTKVDKTTIYLCVKNVTNLPPLPLLTSLVGFASFSSYLFVSKNTPVLCCVLLLGRMSN